MTPKMHAWRIMRIRLNYQKCVPDQTCSSWPTNQTKKKKTWMIAVVIGFWMLTSYNQVYVCVFFLLNFLAQLVLDKSPTPVGFHLFHGK
jgi:hypothetical protein